MNDGAKGEQVLAVTFPASFDLDQFSIVEQGDPAGSGWCPPRYSTAMLVIVSHVARSCPEKGGVAHRGMAWTSTPGLCRARSGRRQSPPLPLPSWNAASNDHIDSAITTAMRTSAIVTPIQNARSTLSRSTLTRSTPSRVDPLPVEPDATQPRGGTALSLDCQVPVPA